jgi:hypothetical protein
MNTQLMEALADILADALLADLETEEEQSLLMTTAGSPTGSVHGLSDCGFASKRS